MDAEFIFARKAAVQHRSLVEIAGEITLCFNGLVPTENKRTSLVEGIDFYYEGSYVVFTADYLRRRGYCCESGCRHCPYGFGPEGLKRRLAADSVSERDKSK